MEEVFEKLKHFVIKESCVDDEEITSTTSLRNDLGLTGDDGVEFLLAFGKAFNVDVSRFMAADYFGAEGGSNLISFVFSLFSVKENRKELTVGHLQKAIKSGRLDEETINN